MTFYDHTVKTNKGEDFDLSALRGKVVLVVNTATGCGFTPQYKGLEALYEQYRDRGFEILDFPCNQFRNQAPESDAEIQQFCTLRYKTQFPRMKKVEVNGENEEPLFTFLKAQQPTEEVKGLKAKATLKAIAKLSDTAKSESDIKWNFTKFLIDREGRVAGRYNPTVEPKKLEGEIAALL